MTPTADYIGRPSTDIAALNSLRPTCECDDAGAPARRGNCGLPPRTRQIPSDAACPRCGRSIDQHPDTGVYSCGVCGWVEGQRPEPIGRIRVTCVSCGTEYECDHDDVWGFDDDAPIYMCGTCQRRRRFDYGA